MDSNLKKKLRALSLELRHILDRDGETPGDLHLRLNELGIWPDRPAKSLDELVLTEADRMARDTVDAFLTYRWQAGVSQKAAFDEFVREAAYSWANRMFTLRCMEARNLIDPVILQQQVYGGRSLVHHRFSRENPAACASEDDGLFVVLALEFQKRAAELPGVFDPNAHAIALRPSISALKRCIALLSGAEDNEALFQAGDTLGWLYQFWNAEEKDKVFERLRTKKGAKIEGADLIPATQLYTEPYMVKFLVQNSLGALWAGLNPDSALPKQWEYYVRDADRTPPLKPDPSPFDINNPPKPNSDPWVRPNPGNVTESSVVAYANTLATKLPSHDPDSFIGLRNQLLDAVRVGSLDKAADLHCRICAAWDCEWPGRRPKLQKGVEELTFLDPACGSGHFLLEAFDLFFEMYSAEDPGRTPEEVCASILNHNLFGIDIDERAIQITYAALWMHAAVRAPKIRPELVTGLESHLVAANLTLANDDGQLESFLSKHPEDAPLAPALDIVLRGLANADQLGTLLRVEEPVDHALQCLLEEEDRRGSHVLRQSQSNLSFLSEQYLLEELAAKRDYNVWKQEVVRRLKQHFQQEASVADPVQGFFGRNAELGLALFDLLSRRYDVVAANPPYIGLKNMGEVLRSYVERYYTSAKRDLYAAVMLRSLELCRSEGTIALVVPQTWMFQDTFDKMRDNPESADIVGQKGILHETKIEVLAQLGRHAFTEVDPPSNVVLVTARKSDADESHHLTGIQIGTPHSAEDQAAILRSVARGGGRESVFRRQQLSFCSIPHAPLCYSVPERIVSVDYAPSPDGAYGSGLVHSPQRDGYRRQPKVHKVFLGSRPDNGVGCARQGWGLSEMGWF